jgi:hypothetical protein
MARKLMGVPLLIPACEARRICADPGFVTFVTDNGVPCSWSGVDICPTCPSGKRRVAIAGEQDYSAL